MFMYNVYKPMADFLFAVYNVENLAVQRYIFLLPKFAPTHRLELYM